MVREQERAVLIVSILQTYADGDGEADGQDPGWERQEGAEKGESLAARSPVPPLVTRYPQ